LLPSPFGPISKGAAGSQLVRTGLAACEKTGNDFVVVLGAPAYYRRFGFS